MVVVTILLHAYPANATKPHTWCEVCMIICARCVAVSHLAQDPVSHPPLGDTQCRF